MWACELSANKRVHLTHVLAYLKSLPKKTQSSDYFERCSVCRSTIITLAYICASSL